MTVLRRPVLVLALLALSLVAALCAPLPLPDNLGDAVPEAAAHIDDVYSCSFVPGNLPPGTYNCHSHADEYVITSHWRGNCTDVGGVQQCATTQTSCTSQTEYGQCPGPASEVIWQHVRSNAVFSPQTIYTTYTVLPCASESHAHALGVHDGAGTGRGCHGHSCDWYNSNVYITGHAPWLNGTICTPTTTTLPGTPSPTTTTDPNAPSPPTTTTTTTLPPSPGPCLGGDSVTRHYHFSHGEWTCHNHADPATPRICNQSYTYTSGGGHSYVTDPCPGIDSITASPPIVDGTVAQTSVTFTVNLESAAPSPMSVLVSFGCCGVPYFLGADLWTRTATFATGEISQTVTVTSRGRALGSGDAVLRLRATASPPVINPVGQTVPSSVGQQHTVVTITPPVPAVELTYVSNYYGYYTTIEEGWRAGFRVSLSRAVTEPLTIGYEITDGTEFLAAGHPTIGSTEITTGDFGGFIIYTEDDMVDEPSGLLEVTLQPDPTQYRIAGSAASVTVTDDDWIPQVSISGPAASVDEGETLVYTVTLSNEQHWTPATFDWETTNAGSATAGADYRSASGTVTFAARIPAVWNPFTWSWTPFVPGETTKTIEVDTLTDLNSPEPDETVVIELSNPIDATLDPANSSASGVIRDVQPPPVVSIAALTPVVDEGGWLRYTLSMAHATAVPVTVDWETTSGTATVGTDYVARSDTATFAAWQTTKTVTVQTLTDLNSPEPDETVIVKIRTADVAAIGTGTATGTIRDVAPPVVSLTSTALTVAETNAAGVQIVAVLDKPAPAAASVAVTTSGAARGYGSCYAGAEYYLSASSFSFSVGGNSATITLYPCSDTDYNNETINVTLSSVDVGGWTFGSPTSTVVTITDTAPPPGPGTVTVTVTAPDRLNHGGLLHPETFTAAVTGFNCTGFCGDGTGPAARIDTIDFGLSLTATNGYLREPDQASPGSGEYAVTQCVPTPTHATLIAECAAASPDDVTTSSRVVAVVGLFYNATREAATVADSQRVYPVVTGFTGTYRYWFTQNGVVTSATAPLTATVVSTAGADGQKVWSSLIVPD